MSLSNKKKTQSTSDIFDDDFEVIYEGDLPDISIDDDDDYRDVLSREFDSWILEKYLAGLIKPAFFMSNFLFLYVLVCNSVL